MSVDFQEVLKTGNIAGWIAELSSEVKKNPADTSARYMLAQAHFLDGNIDKADTHFDLVSTQDPSWGPKIALFRQLLRGMKSRDEWFEEGRPPELLKDPTEYVSELIKAGIEHREGDPAAGALFSKAEELRPQAPGVRDGKQFSDFRDLDDRTGGIIEIITSTGKYYWTTPADVREMSIAPISNPSEVILRQVEMEIIDGPTGIVYIPMVYHSIDREKQDGLHQLGLQTDWSEGDEPPVTGLGRKCILIDDDVMAFGEAMTDIQFST